MFHILGADSYYPGMRSVSVIKMRHLFRPLRMNAWGEPRNLGLKISRCSHKESRNRTKEGWL